MRRVNVGLSVEIYMRDSEVICWNSLIDESIW